MVIIEKFGMTKPSIMKMMKRAMAATIIKARSPSSFPPFLFLTMYSQ